MRVSPALLPHLKDRPVTLKRYPDGVEGFFFYEKECPSHRPKWIKTADVPRSKGGDIHYCVLNDFLPRLSLWFGPQTLPTFELAHLSSSRPKD